MQLPFIHEPNSCGFVECFLRCDGGYDYSECPNVIAQDKQRKVASMSIENDTDVPNTKTPTERAVELVAAIEPKTMQTICDETREKLAQIIGVDADRISLTLTIEA
jgi:hypothetical protein